MNAVLPVMLQSKVALGSAVFCLLVVSAAGTASATPSIKILRGANQQTTYGANFPTPLEVWVTDTATERAVSGLQINFTPGAGVLLSSSFATTDERGLASVTATALAACTSSVSAEVAGVPDARVNFEGLVADKAVLTVIPANLASRRASSVTVISVYNITGFVNGDTAETAQIKGLPVLTTTVGDHSPRANYAIKGGVGSLSAPNYTFAAGFGTLAILEGQDTDNARAQAQAASPASLSRDDAFMNDEVEVHSALLGQAATLTVPEPEFLAGLRGQSGVFVVKAIWTEPATAPDNAQHVDTRSALAPVATGVARASDAPVRPVEIPRMATLSVPAPQLSNTRSALAPLPVAVQKGTDAPVRAVVLISEPSAADKIRSSASSPAIRRAFNPAGSN